jgi:hypothetical protein
MPKHEILCRDAMSENIKLYLTFWRRNYFFNFSKTVYKM